MANLGDNSIAFHAMGHSVSASPFTRNKNPLSVVIAGTGQYALQIPGFNVIMVNDREVMVDIYGSDPVTGEWFFYDLDNGVYYAYAISTGEDFRVTVVGQTVTIERLHTATRGGSYFFQG